MTASLEELDGTAIPGAGRPTSSWLRGVVSATVLAATGPRLWALALTAFLARGGLLVLGAPLFALPSFVGVTTFVGPTSVTPAGPTLRLIVLVVGAVSLAAAAIVGGTAIGAAAETALYRAIVDAAPTVPADDGRRRGAVRQWWGSGGRVLAQVMAIRLLMVVPVGAVVALAVPTYVDVAYRELSLPSDLAVPLWARMLLDAPAATGSIVVTWIAAEVIGGLAVRRIVLTKESVAGAVLGAIGDLVRAPASSLLTLIVGHGGSVLVLGPALLVAAAVGARSAALLLGGPSLLELIAVGVVIAATWLALLTVAAIAAAWRATLWTAMARRRTAFRGRA